MVARPVAHLETGRQPGPQLRSGGGRLHRIAEPQPQARSARILGRQRAHVLEVREHQYAVVILQPHLEDAGDRELAQPRLRRAVAADAGHQQGHGIADAEGQQPRDDAADDHAGRCRAAGRRAGPRSRIPPPRSLPARAPDRRRAATLAASRGCASPAPGSRRRAPRLRPPAACAPAGRWRPSRHAGNRAPIRGPLRGRLARRASRSRAHARSGPAAVRAARPRSRSSPRGSRSARPRPRRRPPATPR